MLLNDQMSQAKISKEDFWGMSSYEKGVAVYLQGDVNDEIPSENPFAKGTKESNEFERGYRHAMERSKFEI